MSVIVQDYYESTDGATFKVGPNGVNSASPWRILSVFVSGTGTISFVSGDATYPFTILKGTFTNDRALPTAANPFPITIGNQSVTCTVTGTTNFAMIVVIEEGIG